MTDVKHAERDALALRKGRGETLTSEEEERLDSLNWLARASANARPCKMTDEERAEWRQRAAEYRAKRDAAKARGEPMPAYSSEEIRDRLSVHRVLAHVAYCAYRFGDNVPEDDGWDDLTDAHQMGYGRIVTALMTHEEASVAHDREMAALVLRRAEDDEQRAEERYLRAKHCADRLRTRYRQTTRPFPISNEELAEMERRCAAVDVPRLIDAVREYLMADARERFQLAMRKIRGHREAVRAAEGPDAEAEAEQPSIEDART